QLPLPPCPQLPFPRCLFVDRASITPMPLSAGARLGPYEILAPLGAGGMGEVYRAKDSRLDRHVAVKVLPDHLARDQEALARFTREAKAVAALNHANILAIHDFDQCGGTVRSEEHTSELQSRGHLVCRLLLEKKKE